MAHYTSLYHGGASMPPLPPEIPVHSIWEDNLELKLRFLHSFVHNARYAAVNIHYPGVIHNGSQKHTSQTADERYSVIKANVDALKPIQRHEQTVQLRSGIRIANRCADAAIDMDSNSRLAVASCASGRHAHVSSHIIVATFRHGTLRVAISRRRFHAAAAVRIIWEDNLELELRFLHTFVHNARYAAVNIHYPGVIHNGGQKHTSQTADERYSVIKANVDALKPIQVGLAIYNDFSNN
ncbi:hypothetical protein BDA96_10G192500 [Sorghum bicolor]|uniref:poly(A)-specific ribonuclease n=1 Tax=Sorghum bicolor TaxID=4558 RepID=A0A921U1G6_SORBI|nr:hypothetical protein BDA96_10G192500 [Sorghum bicolor]